MTGSDVKTEDSPFRDNSGENTTVLVTKDLTKIYFKLQRRIDPKAPFQTIINDPDGERLKLTVNGVDYRADSNGLFAVPKTYVDTQNGDDVETTITPLVIRGLPEKTVEDAPSTERRTYQYSVIECNADGSTAEVAAGNKLTMASEADGTDLVKLTLTKPLGSEDPNTYYRLFRRVRGKSYTYVVTGEDDKAIPGVTAAMSAAVDGKLELVVSTQPTETPAELKFKVRRTTDSKTFTTLTGVLTAVSTADEEVFYQSADTGIFTVPADAADQQGGVSLRISGLNATSAESNTEEGPLTSIVYEKAIAAEKDQVKYPVNEEDIISVPKSTVRRRNILVTVPGLPKYYTDETDHTNKPYTYTVKECMTANDSTEAAKPTLSCSVADSANDTVTLTVKSMAPVLYFQVYRSKQNESTPELVTTVNDNPITASMNGTELSVQSGIITAEEKNMEFSVSVNNLPKVSDESPYGYSIQPTGSTPALNLSASLSDGKVSLSVKKQFANAYYRIYDSNQQVITTLNNRRLQALVGSERITAAPDGTLIVSEYFARGNQLKILIPGLEPGTYTVKQYDEENHELTSEPKPLTAEPGEETVTLEITKTVTATPDVFSFKVMQGGNAVKRIVTNTIPLKGKKFLVSNQQISENAEDDLKAASDNRATIINTLETRDITMALNWEDNGYGSGTGTKKTESMHYPITATLSFINDGAIAKAAAQTEHPGDNEYVPKTYYSGAKGIIRIPYSEHYAVNSSSQETIQSSADRLFTVGNGRAIPLGADKKVFSVLIGHLDAQNGENQKYVYTVDDLQASIKVTPSAEEGKVDVLVEKIVSAEDTHDFVFTLARAVAGVDDNQFAGPLTASVSPLNVMRFTINDLPSQNTDNPYVTYKYTYTIMECDKDGNELTGENAHYFSSSKTNNNYSCSSYLTAGATPTKYFYYKVVVKVELEAKKIITLTHGRMSSSPKVDVTVTNRGESPVTYTLQRKLATQQDSDYEDVIGYTNLTISSEPVSLAELAAEGTNSSGQTESYQYRVVNSEGTPYAAAVLSLTATEPYSQDVMEYSTHYMNNGYQYAVGNGVRFENMPVYDSSRSVIVYNAYESPVESLSAQTPEEIARIAEINDYQIYGLYDTIEKDQEHYQKNGNSVDEKKENDDVTYLSESDEDSYFSTKSNDSSYTRHYFYQGSAQAYTKKESSAKRRAAGAKGENDAASDPVTHINILNTLPLTSVKVEKHWIDQDNRFNLRPSAINDVNKNGTQSDRLNLTLYRSLSAAGSWAQIDYTENSSNETEWYQTQQKLDVGDSEWTLTYQKLLKGDNDNTPYYFKIEETKLSPYEQPQYCAAADYQKAVQNQTYTNKQIITDVNTLSAGSEWDGMTPLAETFEITNKLETIDVTVAKSWADNGYDNTKVDGLHYNVKATLSSDDITMKTGGTYSDDKVIAKTEGNGVIFKNLPRYKENGSAIVYHVTEDATDDDATQEDQETGEVGQLTGAYDGSGTATTAQFTVGSKRYGYVGTCKLATDTDGNQRFDILNTLPLTAVKVNKHWDDQSNEFNLRPTNIKDVNKNENVSDSLNLTLWEKTSATDWAQLAPLDAAKNTESYTGTKVTSGNEWTYTYTKLLKYDVSNKVYSFKITETPLTGYEAPKYCVQGEYDYDTDDDDTTTQQNKQIITAVETLPATATVWNGDTPLDETFDITNRLDTRPITVYKHWDDDGNTATRYPIDITLTSTAANTGSRQVSEDNQTYMEVKPISSTADNQSVVFEKLPKHDKTGAVIVYNVREDAHTDQTSSVSNAVSISEKQSGNATLTGTLPTFTDGYHHFGYYGTAKYVAGTGTVGNESKTYATAYYLTNTLPKVSYSAEKQWDDEHNRDEVRASAVTFTLTRDVDTHNPWNNVPMDAQQTSWRVDFGSYPQCNYNNDPYQYHVSETVLSRYSLTNTSQTQEGLHTHYTFTNRYQPVDQSLTVHKIWNDAGYKDTVRPSDLSKVRVELYYKYRNAANTAWVTGKVAEDTLAVKGIKAHIEARNSAVNAEAYSHLTDEEKAAKTEANYQQEHAYVYAPTLSQFSAVSGHADYESTYVFNHLPVYINLNGSATEAGEHQAVHYYVVESFTENGHVYKREYSLGASDQYSSDAEAMATTLTTTTTNEQSQEVTNPADKTINIQNTPKTRDILVTKDWDDNGYGVTTGTAKVSALSKQLHYVNTKIQLTGTTTLDGTETTVYATQDRYLAKANTDPDDSTNYKGVVFRDVPIYDRNGEVISYKVTESKDTNGTASEDLLAPDSGDVLSPVDSGEFEQLKGEGQYSNRYQGSAKKVTEDETITEEGVTPAVTKTYVTRFHITDTLPLTAVDVVKTWDDEDNEFSLRPDDIASDLTLSRFAAQATVDNPETKTFYPLTSVDNNRMYVTDSASYPAKTNNTYTYTYKKILKYADNNDPYIFKIEESQETAYQSPSYTKAYLNYTEVLEDNPTTNGQTALSNQLQVKNTLDTRSITVTKHWDDSNNTYSTRYLIQVTLTSTAANVGSRQVSAQNQTYKEVKEFSSTEDNQSVVFEKLPKYDSTGAVIVYNVREDAVSVQTSSVSAPVSITAQQSGSATLTGTSPTFTDGYHHYGYYGTATYAAETATVGNETKTYVTGYEITNTLPQTAINVTKTWADIPAQHRYQGTYQLGEETKNYQDVTVNLTRSSNGTADSDFHPSDTMRYSTAMSTAFLGLPVYDNDNRQYTYQLEEAPLLGYTTKYSYSTVSDSDTPPQFAAVKDVTNTVNIHNTPIMGTATILKIDQNHYDAYSTHTSNNYQDIPLEGAKFNLTYGDSNSPVFVSKNAAGEYVIDSSSTSNVVVTGSDGTIVFKDFPLNDYHLVETEAPQNYKLWLTDGKADFTISVDNASDKVAAITYENGFIQNGNNDNRIGNLQKVEEVQVTLVKTDADDSSIRLPDTTYYLLQMVPHTVGGDGYDIEHYHAAADAEIQRIIDNNGQFPEGMTLDNMTFWHKPLTSSNTSLPYIYTTNGNGEIGPIMDLMTGRYAFVEVKAAEGYEVSFCKPFVISDTKKVVRMEHKDPRKKANLNVLKVNEYGDPLGGGIFDLLYRPDAVTSIPYYTPNSAVAPPAMTYQLDTATEPETPLPKQNEPTYSYSYSNEYKTVSVPRYSAKSWILPRTDNDYIYFEENGNDTWRTYNINTGKPGTNQEYYYEWDNAVGKNGSGNFRIPKGDLFIDRSPVYADFYRDGSSEKMGQYEVWERFVYYLDDNGNYKVIWKIQPPDGATQVVFHQGWDKYTNQTRKFTFTKGKIYNKQGLTSELGTGTHAVTDGDWIDFNDTGTKKAGNSGVAYEPTAQKLIFRRNSEYCWDNLHVEFFKDAAGTQPVGESFPGYLMEPYAYANSSYHIQYTTPKSGWDADYAERYLSGDKEYYGNLSYEITIPKDAQYFRINNGTQNAVNGTYSGYGSFTTAITKLAAETDKKNDNNYWKLAPSGTGSPYGYSAADGTTEVGLQQWSSADVSKAGDKLNDTSFGFEVESDSDFVYFQKPSGWKDHIYAYFYAGGNLRENNWQRAVYSIWPGVIPYGSTVVAPNESGNYENFADGIGNMQRVTGSAFKDASGNTLYRFRLPIGDNKNYTKIIFSDGLVGSGDGLQTGYPHGDGVFGHESQLVDCKPGYAYNKDAGEWPHADQLTATQTYLFRKSDGSGTTANLDDADYLYIRNNSADPWDDVHITFYNASGGEILQTGTGYVMKYSGTNNDGEYFRVPIPSNAAQFAINNGSKKTDGRSTGKYQILQHGDSNTATTTTGYQVYEITSKTALKLISPEEVVHVTETMVTEGSAEQSQGIDYTIRTHNDSGNDVKDYVWIQNTGDWVSTKFYYIQFLFYDAGSARITSDDKTYPAFKREDEPSGTEWICKEIPVNAASFSIIMDGNPSGPYDIYPQASSGTQKAFTNGDMIYQTGSGNTLSLSWPTNVNYLNTSGSVEANDNFGENARGDYLYLVDTGKNSAWNNMVVEFYQDDGTTPIANILGDTRISAVHLEDIGKATGTAVSGETTLLDEAVGTWYRISIPKNAASFKLFDSDTDMQSDTSYPIFPLRSTYSSYKKDYTLGHMQYSIPASGNGDTYTLERIYPVFTETEESTNPYGSGEETPADSFSQTADSINKRNNAPLTSYDAVEPYASLPTVTVPEISDNHLSDIPVLYAANTDSITYQWGNGTDYSQLVGFVRPFEWGTVKAHYWGGTHNSTWPGDTAVSTYSFDGETIDFFDLKGCPNVIFHNGEGAQTEDFDLSSYTASGGKTNGQGYVFKKGNLSSGKYNVDLAYYPTGAVSSSTASGVDSDYIYFVCPTGDNWSTHLTRAHFWGGDNPTTWPGMSWDSSVGYSSITIDGSSYNAYAWKVDNKTGNVLFNCLPNSTTNESTHDPIYQTADIEGFVGGTVYATDVYEEKDTYYCTTCNSYHTKRTYTVTTLYPASSFGVTAQEITYPTVESYSASYQPEDRYGYIFDVNSYVDVVRRQDGTSSNGKPTVNNFINIVISGTITDPYIMFYSDETGTDGAKIGGNSMATHGISLKAVLGEGTPENPYSIRLPKNARSFRIGNGTIQSASPYVLNDDAGSTFTVTSSDLVIARSKSRFDESSFVYVFDCSNNGWYGLIPNVYFYNRDNNQPVDESWPGKATTYLGESFLLGGGGDNIPVANHRPARVFRKYIPSGATTLIVNVYKDNLYNQTKEYDYSPGFIYRIGNNGGPPRSSEEIACDVSQANSIIYSQNQRTDLDYIYFTDTNGWAGGGQAYAYFYGSVDGEYNAWPGVPAAGSYQDNNGKTVYYFRTPATISDNTYYPYPYVIFNNGSSDTRKITQKIEYQTGKIYTPTSENGVAYGPVTPDAKAVSSVSKTGAGYVKQPYDQYTPSEKYIYIVNNGTQNVTSDNVADLKDNNCYQFDEMHVTFYSDEGQTLVGTMAPGYYADKLAYGKYDGNDVYKISVPTNAKYFQISNGQGKGNGSENHARKSVVQQLSINGLYRFVDASDDPQSLDNYWEGGSVSDLSRGNYYLTLMNERKDGEEDDEPVITGNSDPVYLATVVTDENGLIQKITALRTVKDENDEDQVDTEYLDHVMADINNSDVKTVRVKKWGTYYWKEVQPPVGYQQDKNEWDDFTVDAKEADKAVSIFTATDTRKHGKVTLTKTSEQALGDNPIGTKLKDAKFRLYSTADTSSPVYLLNKTDAAYYTVPTVKEGKSSISQDHKYLEVTDPQMLEDLNGYQLYGGEPNQFALVELAVTDNTGKFTIDNLDWGQYYLSEETAPDGYTNIDKAAVSANSKNRVDFSVGRNTCMIDQQLSCTNEIKTAKLKIEKELEEYLDVWGTPTFIFKIQKISGQDTVSYEKVVSLQVTDQTNKKVSTEIDVEPGTYRITEMNVSRYSPKSCALDSEHSSDTQVVSVSGDKRTITLTVEKDGTAVVKYVNQLDYYDKFSHTDREVNFFKGYKALRVEYNQKVPVTDDSAEIAKGDLTVRFVKSDGTLSDELTAVQKNSLRFAYVKQSDYDDERFAITDDTDNNQIVIDNPAYFADGVYRLKATYGNGISGTFDITFDGKTKDKMLYEKTVIFHADVDNLSYYADEYSENGVTSQYVFTFTVAEDENSNRQITSRKHNGVEVTAEDVENIIKNLPADHAPLQIIETHSHYSFNNTWIGENGDPIASGGLAGSIDTVVKTDNDTVVYTAQLTHS